jgi:hypothetical protein
MKQLDRLSHDYEELLAVQAQHFNNLRRFIKPEILQPVVAYAKATNRPAEVTVSAHRVYRGQDLIQLVMQWPDLTCYAPMPTAEEELV